MPTTDIKGAIDAANRRYEAAVAAQSASDVVALYTPDAVILPPDRAAVSGHDAIADMYTTIFGNGIAWIELTTDALRSVRDDVVVEQGRYRVGAVVNEPVDTGAYTVYWLQSGDDWLMFRDVIVTATVEC